MAIAIGVLRVLLVAGLFVARFWGDEPEKTRCNVSATPGTVLYAGQGEGEVRNPPEATAVAAAAHPMFRHVGLVTVTAADLDQLEEACNRVEHAAAQSLVDLHPLGCAAGGGMGGVLAARSFG